jgi:hypothetical protein
MLVFREGKRSVSAVVLVQQLQNVLAGISSQQAHSDEALLPALLYAGELECALADAGSEAAQLAATITESLADCLVANESISLEPLLQSLEKLSSGFLPQTLTVSLPEGFAYYALHPLSYVEALTRVHEAPHAAVVVGIRSIGTTLSAVVNAYFSSTKIPCVRFTVRPVGHPFDRYVELAEVERRVVAKALTVDATFYVVDEGPGLSGSSFLATAEALLRVGVPSTRIVLLCRNQPDFNVLFATNAAERWQRFRTVQVKAGSHIPAGAEIFFGGGRWREFCFSSKEEWPACWLQMERLKFLTSDQRKLFRFDGLGSYGSHVRERYLKVAEAGYGPACESAGNGFTCFPMIGGAIVRRVTQPLVKRAAEYCAFRAGAVVAELTSNQALEEMARINVERELGCAVGDDFHLEIVRPVIADGKMMLHEWLEPEKGGPALKLDSAAHGDDHFFPGATDIAWDIAGAIVEWQMDELTADDFLKRYERMANDRVQTRLRPYQIAYAAFRMGYSKMAAAAMPGQEEESRLLRDYGFYKESLARMLAVQAAA